MKKSPNRKRALMEINKRYFKYWGKADRNDPDKYHLLPYHCLDVAAAGWVLLKPKGPLCHRIASQLGVTPDWLRDFFSFCLALHDIGKFSRAFQGLKKGLAPPLVTPNPRMRYAERHDTLGFMLLRENPNMLGSLFSDYGECTNYLEPWIEIITGHHGIPPKKSGVRIPNFFEPEDEKAATYFIKDAYTLFLSHLKHTVNCTKTLKQRLKPISWQLAGIAVLADWLGSDRDYFNFYREPVALFDYWHNHALPAAEKAFRRMSPKPKPNRFQSVEKLFPFIKKPTPLQEYAISEPLSDSPQLFILEDVTGSGKTEAALILAQRLLSAGLVDGLYVALPTMATANAMYQRLGRAYRRLFGSDDLPSLILAHGSRDLSKEFRDSVFLQENSTESINYDDGSGGQDVELNASAYCNEWLADNRKKALLADVGVGTLDQALLGVLPARHQSLRLLGLGRKLLIVDEVHAYDSYMQTLLDALIETCARQGGSVILLSATLPIAMRKKLSHAFQRGLGSIAPTISNAAYPLATHSPAKDRNETHIDTRDEVKRTVIVKQMETEETIIKTIQQSVRRGQCVCWIRNTVKAARSSHRLLSDCDWVEKDHLHLFHSRFAMIDRQQIEMETLRRFGKISTNEDRKGRVLVATQVVEQSLDLDFDVLISDLAPIDLIIQRAGRLHRHVRDKNGNRNIMQGAKDERGTPVLYLLCPVPEQNADENWLKIQQPGTLSIYPHIGQLWLTAKLLLPDGEGKITMPDDARCLIEGVYSNEAQATIPQRLLDASLEADGKNMMQQSMANLNTLKLNKGYTRSSGVWDEETRIPTRLSEQETVSVALAEPFQEGLRAYASGTYHEWAMSVVNIPDREWETAKQLLTKTMKKKIDNLKKEVKALRWFEVFPLTDETNGCYSPTGGWQP